MLLGVLRCDGAGWLWSDSCRLVFADAMPSALCTVLICNILLFSPARAPQLPKFQLRAFG